MAQQRLRLLRRRGVETVILAGADTHGITRGKRLPIAELPHATEHGVALCEVIEPPPAVDGDVYALADGAIPALPTTLAEAL